MKTSHPFRSGFSLIEVSAALCIISVALTSLMALIPMGLANTRSTKAETRAAEVAHAIFNTLACEPFTKARCFSRQDPLDLSQLGRDTGTAPTVLYATFDVLRKMNDQPLTIIRSDTVPDVMSRDLELYRIELQNTPQQFSSNDSAAVGSVVRLTVFVGRDKTPVFRGASFVGSYGKAGVLQQSQL